jgi:xanthine dehydrogenase accessory factor
MNCSAPIPRVAVLGTNEIASAVAVHLHSAGWQVVLCHDVFPPVIRRGMAFHDVLFGERRVIAGVTGARADTTEDVAAECAAPDRVAVTALPLADLVAVRPLAVVVDARMQKRRTAPDLRGVANLTVGLGPLFRIGENCDIAVETRPARNGEVITSGATDEADGVASQLGGAGRERFVYSDRPGRWHTPLDIGARVFRSFVVGHCDGAPVRAPFDGIVRGIVRDGLRVPAGVKLIEMDPRGRKARWTGIDDRGRAIAEATVRAIGIGSPRLADLNLIDARMPA